MGLGYLGEATTATKIQKGSLTLAKALAEHTGYHLFSGAKTFLSEGEMDDCLQNCMFVIPTHTGKHLITLTTTNISKTKKTRQNDV